MPVTTVGQGLDNATFRHPARGAFLNHPPQFRSQSGEADNAFLDFSKACFCDPVGNAARLIRVVLQRQKRADCLDIEAEFTRMLDEGKSRYGVFVIAPLLPFGARWRQQQADLFIVAYGRHLHFGAPREFANRKIYEKAS